MNLTEIEKHYSESIKKYGTVSKGVGWNNEEGQILRFQKLLSICPPPPIKKALVSTSLVVVMVSYIDFFKKRNIGLIMWVMILARKCYILLKNIQTMKYL